MNIRSNDTGGTEMDKDFERYKDLDFSDAKTVAEVPALQRLQQTRANYRLEQNVFAPDVVGLINQHSNNERDVIRLNQVIRALFA